MTVFYLMHLSTYPILMEEKNQKPEMEKVHIRIS